MSRISELDSALKELRSGTPEVEACALISEDGLVIASALPQNIEEIRVAGMSATLMSLGTRVATELERGQVRQVLVSGENGYAILSTAAEGTMLLVLTTRMAKLGLVFLDMARTTEALARALKR